MLLEHKNKQKCNKMGTAKKHKKIVSFRKKKELKTSKTKASSISVSYTDYRCTVKLPV